MNRETTASRQRTAQLRPFAYLLIAIFAVSCSAILVRLCATPPLVIAFYRQLFCASMLLPFVNFSDEHVPFRTTALIWLSGLFLALHFATWLVGLTLTSVARATLFVDLQPIWAAILGGFILKERLSRAEVLAIVLVTSGAALSMAGHWQTGIRGSLTGDLLSVAGGIAGASYFLIGRSVRLLISWQRYMLSVYLSSAAWLLLFCYAWVPVFPLPFEKDLGWIILMALIPGIAGHGLFNLAIRYLKSFVVNAAFLGEPVLATFCAYLVFHEIPDRYFIAGGTMVFIGLALLFQQQRKALEVSS